MYESLWKDLFFDFRQDRTIEISLRGSPETTRSLRIFYNPSDVPAIPLADTNKDGTTGQTTDSSAILPITFELQDVSRETRVFQPKLGLEGLSLGGMAQPTLSAFYSSAFAGLTGPAEAAGQFSELSKRKEDGQVREALREVFPSIENVSIEINAGVPTLFCEVPWMSIKTPVALVSGGINKLLAILLGISSQPRGVVLVDEIENGLYYDSLPRVWASLRAFCQQFNVQLFATTHSLECLRAVLPTLKKHERDFRLIRAERKDGRRAIRLFNAADFEAAIETKIEVRG
jgi:hypothetical protein